MDREKEIKVTKPGHKYKSKTRPPSREVSGGDEVVWTIEHRLPAPARVQLRFENSRLFGSDRLTENPTKKISAIVQNTGLKKGERFPYTVWSVHGNTDYCMEDPELVMDSDTPLVGPKKKKVDEQKTAAKSPNKKKKAPKR